MVKTQIGRCFLGALVLGYLSGGICADDHLYVAGHRILKTHNQDNSTIVKGRTSVVFQDRIGRFWIADSSNLYLYDEKRNVGDRITNQASELGIGSIGWIGQSGDDRLWFAGGDRSPVSGSNLSCFDGEHWLKPDRIAPSSVLNDKVTAMFPGGNGKIWFAVKDRLAAYNGLEWKPRIRLSEAIQDDDAVTVRAGLQDRSGYIWLGTTQGILRFNESRNEWAICDPFERDPISPGGSLNSPYAREMAKRGVVAIYEDRRRRIWFIDAEGHVMIWKESEKTWTSDKLSLHLPSERRDLGFVHAMYQDRRGQMMFATSRGLLVFSENNARWELLTQENSGLPDTLITSIFEDSSGRIWIGTGKGIVVLEP